MVLNSTQNLKKYLLSVTLLLLASSVFSQGVIKGNITDAKTGATLIDATVSIEKIEFKQNTTVRLDGSYLFKNVPAGSYKLHARYVGYKNSKEYSVEVSANNEAVLNIAMVDNATSLTEVTVTEHASKSSERS